MVAGLSDPSAAWGDGGDVTHLRGCCSTHFHLATQHALGAAAAVLLQPGECGSHHLHWQPPERRATGVGDCGGDGELAAAALRHQLHWRPFCHAGMAVPWPALTSSHWSVLDAGRRGRAFENCLLLKAVFCTLKILHFGYNFHQVFMFSNCLRGDHLQITVLVGWV